MFGTRGKTLWTRRHHRSTSELDTVDASTTLPADRYGDNGTPTISERGWWFFFLFFCTATVSVTAADDDLFSRIIRPAASVSDDRCEYRMRRALTAASSMDLSRYALHRRLRTVPGAEMYVTEIRAAVADDRSQFGGRLYDIRPWAQIAGCRYYPSKRALHANMRFGGPLTVTGTVRLVYDGNVDGKRTRQFLSGGGSDFECRVVARLRSVGVDFTASPAADSSAPADGYGSDDVTVSSSVTIRTTASLVDAVGQSAQVYAGGAVRPSAGPVSVRAYNCENLLLLKTNHDESGQSDTADWRRSPVEDINDVWTTADDELRNDRDDVYRIEIDGSGHGEGDEELSGPDGSRFVYDATNFESYGPRVLNKRRRPPQPQQGGGHDRRLRAVIEIEESYVRGVRQLLTKYLERTLQQPLRDSLMVRMGFVTSYG
ncbi:uncharacterized protein LOC126898720 [Daktulosphaira vitifoliae]|uniref:uncharacterized protein LOC126898720 n=1 Tax=Daktulosphaira vitifoliae TaxID=58002 RepID=UPI0021A99BF2|nr:uncharacterized protein LOC126898720 [Daktulosphaira vitifoliae]